MPSEKTEILTNQEKLSSNEYREQLRQQALEILSHPSIDQLLAVSAENGRLTEEDIEELTSPELTEDKYLQKRASLVQKAMDWRTAPDGTMLERSQIPNEDDLPQELREQIQDTAKQLEMFDEVPMPDKDPDIVGIFGATVGPVEERTDYAFDHMRGHPRMFGLGAERAMLAPDLKHAETYPYVTAYKNARGDVATYETNLMAEAQLSWLERHGYTDAKISRYMRDPFSSEEARDVDDPNKILRKKTKPSPYGFQLVEFTGDNKPEWAPRALVSISPTYNQEKQTRADTGDTIRFMFEMAEADPTLPPDADVVFVSHGIYRLGQDLEAKRVCVELGDYRVTTIGYEQKVAAGAKLLGGEIGKVVHNASALLTALKNQPSA